MPNIDIDSSSYYNNPLSSSNQYSTLNDNNNIFQTQYMLPSKPLAIIKLNTNQNHNNPSSYRSQYNNNNKSQSPSTPSHHYYSTTKQSYSNEHSNMIDIDYSVNNNSIQSNNEYNNNHNLQLKQSLLSTCIDSGDSSDDSSSSSSSSISPDHSIIEDGSMLTTSRLNHEFDFTSSTSRLNLHSITNSGCITSRLRKFCIDPSSNNNSVRCTHSARKNYNHMNHHQVNDNIPLSPPCLYYYPVPDHQRSCILYELYHSELLYVQNLTYLQYNYIAPLSNNVLCTSLNMKLTTKNAIFLNIEQITKFHNETFLPALQSACQQLISKQQNMMMMNNQFNSNMNNNNNHNSSNMNDNSDINLNSIICSISRMFTLYGQYFKLYAYYVSNYNDSNIVLQCTAKENKKFSCFLDEQSLLGAANIVQCNKWAQISNQQHNNNNHNMMNNHNNIASASASSSPSIQSLLIQPIQRLGRYELFLSKLLQCSEQQLVEYKTLLYHCSNIYDRNNYDNIIIELQQLIIELRSTCTSMENTNHYVNEYTRSIENQVYLCSIADTLLNLPNKFTLLQPTRKCLFHSIICINNNKQKQYNLLLCNDIILINNQQNIKMKILFDIKSIIAIRYNNKLYSCNDNFTYSDLQILQLHNNSNSSLQIYIVQQQHDSQSNLPFHYNHLLSQINIDKELLSANEYNNDVNYYVLNIAFIIDEQQQKFVTCIENDCNLTLKCMNNHQYNCIPINQLRINTQNNIVATCTEPVLLSPIKPVIPRLALERIQSHTLQLKHMNDDENEHKEDSLVSPSAPSAHTHMSSPLQCIIPSTCHGSNTLSTPVPLPPSTQQPIQRYHRRARTTSKLQ